jgi:hypothetical protein
MKSTLKPKVEFEKLLLPTILKNRILVFPAALEVLFGGAKSDRERSRRARSALFDKLRAA